MAGGISRLLITDCRETGDCGSVITELKDSLQGWQANAR